MNPIYRGQYPPKNTDVLWIKDNQIYIYQNGGWKATSGGGTADFNAKEGESGYIANKPLSKTVTTETTTYGSGNTYVDANHANPGPGGDVFRYVYAANGGTLKGHFENYVLKAEELYFMRLAMPTEPGMPTEEVVDMGYIGVGSSNMRVVFRLIESWLTEDQQSGSANYVDIYNSRVFFKPDEEIKTASDFDYAAFDIIGLDPEDPNLTPEIVLQALTEHESEVLAFCDNYIYKTAGGILVITPYAWSEQEQRDVSKAYIAGPSDTYMNYWVISSEHKVVENFAMLSKGGVSSVCIVPVISEVYGANPTEEQEDEFYDKAGETTLSDYGMSSIAEITTMTTEYQQLEEGYLPDNLKLVVGTPRIIGIVPGDQNISGKDLPIVEYAYYTNIFFNKGYLYTRIYTPNEVQTILNNALGNVPGAYAHIDLCFIKFAATAIGHDYGNAYPTDLKYNSGISYRDENNTDHTVTITRIEFTSTSGSRSYFTLNYESLANSVEIPAFIMCRYYPTGGTWNGSM